MNNVMAGLIGAVARAELSIQQAEIKIEELSEEIQSLKEEKNKDSGNKE